MIDNDNCIGCECCNCEYKYECDECRECSRNYSDNYCSGSWCEGKVAENDED